MVDTAVGAHLEGRRLMFPDCVIPGCRNPVAEVGEACSECVREFGTMLRHNADGRRLTAAEIAERDSYIHQQYAFQAMLRKVAP
jgi:hypothetical protein